MTVTAAHLSSEWDENGHQNFVWSHNRLLVANKEACIHDYSTLGVWRYTATRTHHNNMLCTMTSYTAPLEAKLSLVPEAMKVGLRSDIGLALIMFPPTACEEKKHHLKRLELQ